MIQEHIKRPLAEELFGRLEKGGHAFVGVAPDGTLKIGTFDRGTRAAGVGMLE